jgi:hypothetical protein
MSEVHKFRRAGDNNARDPCPAPETWGELAAGLMPREKVFELLEHAGSCPACAEELQYALFAIGDTSGVAEEIREHMATSKEEWQREFAQQIGAGEIPTAATRTAIPQPGSFRRLISRTWTRLVVAVGKKKPSDE